MNAETDSFQNSDTVIPDPGHWGMRDFADMFSITPRTVRFYEDKGLISPKRESGSRIFGPRDYLRVKKILRGKRLGFSLDDIRDVFDVADGHVSDRAELIRRKNNFQAVIRSLKRRRQDIRQLTSEMDALCDDIEQFLEANPDTDADQPASVFAHAAAYEAAFAKTLITNGDDDYAIGYPAHTDPSLV